MPRKKKEVIGEEVVEKKPRKKKTTEGGDEVATTKKPKRFHRTKRSSPGGELLILMKTHGLTLTSLRLTRNKKSEWECSSKGSVFFTCSNELVARGLLYFLAAGVLIEQDDKLPEADIHTKVEVITNGAN